MPSKTEIPEKLSDAVDCEGVKIAGSAMLDLWDKTSRLAAISSLVMVAQSSSFSREEGMAGGLPDWSDIVVGGRGSDETLRYVHNVAGQEQE